MLLQLRGFSGLNLLCYLLFLAIALTPACSNPRGQTAQQRKWLKNWTSDNQSWRGIHLMIHNDQEVIALIEELPKFATLEVNALILEINYCFEFQSHPELRSSQFVTGARARQLAQEARDHGIRLIPQFNCLGHQSWSKTTLPLLVQYPQFDETPGQYPENKDIYCRSWCPQNPEVNPVVFALIDEIIDVFAADAFHVGMDEVFLIASEHCARCRGGDPAKLFAKAINDLHQHLVGERQVEMLLWGDRLLDAASLGYSEWEAAKNGTQSAVDLIPEDIIICDWHYGKQTNYASVPFLLQKGFRVWPAGWQPVDATKAFSTFALKEKNPRMLGYLCTTWGKVPISQTADWPPIREVLKDWTTIRFRE